MTEETSELKLLRAKTSLMKDILLCDDMICYSIFEHAKRLRTDIRPSYPQNVPMSEVTYTLTAEDWKTISEFLNDLSNKLFHSKLLAKDYINEKQIKTEILKLL